MSIPQSDSPVPPKACWRFSLGGLFGFITVVCVWLTVMSLKTTDREITFHCGTLPPNDHALIAWYQRQEGTKDVRATRDGDSVTVRIKKHEFFPTFELSTPPMKDLGYGQVTTMGFRSSSGWKIDPRPAFQWGLRHYRIIAAAAAAAILLAIYLASRGNRKTAAGGTGPKNPEQVP
jgi:hypothetical protein